MGWPHEMTIESRARLNGLPNSEHPPATKDRRQKTENRNSGFFNFIFTNTLATFLLHLSLCTLFTSIFHSLPFKGIVSGGVLSIFLCFSSNKARRSLEALLIRMLVPLLLGFHGVSDREALMKSLSPPNKMPEGVMAVVKPEMKSYIWLQTTDGSIQQVEEEVAMFCPMICREILQTGMGSSKNYAISLPQRVNPAILGLILDYCRFHQIPGHSNKERKTFDEKFVRMDTKRLCELTSAADSLQLKPLVDLTSRALARIIEGKTPEEIRETFHLPDDLTEEEKLEPLKNITDDPRIRLLNRLYARKRKELKEREKLKTIDIEEHEDDRSVDDLLSFINGGDQDSKGVRTTKNKKKNRRRKEQLKESSDGIDVNYNKEFDAAPAACKQGNIDNILIPTPSKTSKFQDSAAVSFAPKLEFDDADVDDDIDPAMKEELDREVEDFARRLNSDWPERMQEILSLGHEGRLVPMSINGDAPMGTFTKWTAA